MLSSVLHAVVSWLLGLSLANAIILAAVAYYVIKNGGPTVVSKVGGFLSPVSTRVSALESDVALIKAQMAGTAGAYTAPAAAKPAAQRLPLQRLLLPRLRLLPLTLHTLHPRRLLSPRRRNHERARLFKDQRQLCQAMGWHGCGTSASSRVR